MIGKLKANNTFLDLTEGVPMPFNYSIADAKNPEKRKRNFSKELILPGTKLNLNFFSSAYLLALSTLDNTTTIGFNFDPTIRIPAKFYSESGDVVFNGLLRLNEVVIENNNYKFKCTLFSNFIDLFLKLGSLKVSELGWSEYDHLLTRTNVINSFETSVMLNGVDTSNMTAGSPQGWGYHYGMVDYGYPTVAPSTLKTTDIIPMVYWKEVIEKCLAVAGFTYSSAFFETTLFKKFLLGFGGGEKLSLPAQEIANRRCTLSVDFTNSNTFTYFDVIDNGNNPNFYKFYSNEWVSLIDTVYGATTTVNTDIYNQFTSGYITIVKEGLYNIDVNSSITTSITIGSMVLQNGLFNTKWVLLKNGVEIANEFYTDLLVFNTQVINFSNNYQLNVGDVIEIRYNAYLEATYLNLAPITLTIDDNNTTVIDIKCVQASLQDNNNVEISRFIPDIKASSFLEGVFNACNIYMSDPDYTDTVYIEPLSDFYQPTTSFVDITALVDHSKPITIIPSSNIEGKFYKFNWLKDEDYENKKYFDTFGLGYGNHTFVVPSTFQTGDRVYQLPFAQSIPNDDTFPFIRPSIINYDPITNIVKPYKGKPRVYCWNGLKAGNWRLTNTDGISYTDLSTYPCVHHFDNYENPTFDLNWGLPLKLFYTTNVVTTYNLFTRHHERFIKEITGRDSKIVRLNMRINSSFVESLDFSKNIMWDGVLFRLNEIKDWDENITESTQIELIRIIQANAPKTQVTYGEYIFEQEISTLTSPNGSGTDTPIVIGGIDEILLDSQINFG